MYLAAEAALKWGWGLQSVSQILLSPVLLLKSQIFKDCGLATSEILPPLISYLQVFGERNNVKM